MANHKSATKQHRQSLDRRQRNRLHRSRLRTAVKRLRKAVEAGDGSTADSLLRPTLSIVDRTAKLGVIHSKTADRTKSRLTVAVSRLRVAS